jgi:hypothetical protein
MSMFHTSVPHDRYGRRVQLLGLASAAGLTASWVGAAVWYSDRLLVAGLVCGALSLAVLLTSFRVGRRTALWVGIASLAAVLLCGAVAGLRWVIQLESYVRQHSRFVNVEFALEAYADKHGSRFPPAASRGPDGRPLLSWRVLVLPYLDDEAKQLYQEFRLDEPWDSEHNLRLLPRMPRQYRPVLPVGASDPPFTTRCQVLVGRGTAFEGPEGLGRRSDFPDGVSNTLLFVEGRTPVPWTKPEDIPYDPAGPLPPLGPEIPRSLCDRVFGPGRPVSVMGMKGAGSGGMTLFGPEWTEGEVRKLIERDNGAPGRR